MASDIVSEVRSLLRSNKTMDNFNIEIIGDSGIEQGIMGEVIPIILTNKTTQETDFIILKQQKSENGKPIEFSRNEIENEAYFYKCIWKKFCSLYKDRTGKTLKLIPNCLGLSQNIIWRIALENVSSKGFKMLHRTTCLDEDHLTILFKTYGVFHSLSMILKHRNEQEYCELVKPLLPTFQPVFKRNQTFAMNIKGILQQAQRFFDPHSENDVIKKMILFGDDGPELCYHILDEDKSKGFLLHGDCWSNNFMFKYNENNKVEDVKLIDFQQIHSGSPVLDLSYSLYGGGTGESFNRLNHYLKIYHKGVSDNLKEFNLDVEKIYPFNRLKEEWKKYCKFGFSMALMTWRIKFIHEEGSVEVSPNLDGLEFLEPIRIREDKEDEYKQRIRELVYHMYDNDFL